MFEGVRNILVIKLRHIGDVLLTVPAIRALKETFPGAKVSALVNSGTEDMLTLNPIIHEVIAFNRSIKGRGAIERAGGELGFLKDLRARGFDMTVDLTGGDRPALLGFLTGAKYRLGYRPRGGFMGKKLLYTHLAESPRERTHTVLRDLGVVRAFGIDTKDLTVDIYASPEDDSFVENILEENGIKKGDGFVHVHPASRWMFKCWTDEGMAYVMDSIQGCGLRAVITCGPEQTELEKVRSIISKMRTSPVDLSGKIRLKHLACLSRRARLFFGVDSAPMHIGACAGVPVVAIFGPSGAFDWGPWGMDAAKGYKQAPFGTPYPKKGGLQAFGGNIVIQKDWDCVPCGKDGCKGTKKSRCLDEIEGPYVWSILKGALEAHT